MPMIDHARMERNPLTHNNVTEMPNGAIIDCCCPVMADHKVVVPVNVVEAVMDHTRVLESLPQSDMRRACVFTI
jgi:hypothetical protein